jgi:hypothetical protein
MDIRTSKELDSDNITKPIYIFFNIPLLFAICINTFSKLVWGLGECDMGRGTQWCLSVINSEKSQVWHEG